MSIPKDFAELQALYTECENCDKDLFAEMRTNVQLVAGDHYNRAGSRYWNRIRESKQLSPEVRLRLTKNHIGKISKIYRNAIIAHAPGVAVTAKNKDELQDQKIAELNQKVWDDIKYRHKFWKKQRGWANDFQQIGEVAVKVFWDPTAGYQLGWEPEVDEMGNPVYQTDELGMPVMDATGQPVMVASNRPVMTGDLHIETIHGYDLLRHPNAKDWDDSPVYIHRKMVNAKDYQKKYAHDPEKAKLFVESTTDTFRIYEGSTQRYREVKGMTMIREFYFRPCPDYPTGYFFFTTEEGVFEEGALPEGLFPIVFERFDEILGSPRGFSWIRHARPYQIEINRSASKIAEHQITLGDDKLVLWKGGKADKGTDKPGVRRITVSPGQNPLVIPGRSGAQYVDYMNSQIEELYRVTDTAEEEQLLQGDVDPYTLLFRSMRQKKRFIVYSERYESFLREVCLLCLGVLKAYAPDELLERILGPNEKGNIPEFRSSQELDFSIKLEAQTEDAETKMGKQIMIDKTLQYVGSTLDRDDIGKFIRLSPYMNEEQMFEDFTMKFDKVRNVMLALDRGEMVEADWNDDHKYFAEKLSFRTTQPDFRHKHPYIKELYRVRIEQHNTFLAQQVDIEARLKQGLIPAGGYMVHCDFYVGKTDDPSKTTRLELPSQSIQWLVEQLQRQKALTKGADKLPVGVKAQIANKREAAVPADQMRPGGEMITQPSFAAPTGV